jgi:hypothetical protein
MAETSEDTGIHPRREESEEGSMKEESNPGIKP